MSEREQCKVDIRNRPVSPPPPRERDAVWQEHRWRMQAQGKCEQLTAEIAALRAQVERLEGAWKGADHPDRARLECGDRVALRVDERERRDAPIRPRIVMLTVTERGFVADDEVFSGYGLGDGAAWAREADLLAAVLRETDVDNNQQPKE